MASQGAAPSKTLWWPWLVAIAVLAASGWYYRAAKSEKSSADAATPGAPSKGKGGFGAGGLVVPVVVAAAPAWRFARYFNGLGTVTAFNTVTVRSRVDGQLVSVAFKEGQFVMKGIFSHRSIRVLSRFSWSRPKGNSPRTRPSARMPRSI